jgi:hypothetical protein
VAFATREVIIANPGKKMAQRKKMSLKDRAAFARRMARARNKKHPKRNPAKKSHAKHRTRSKPRTAPKKNRAVKHSHRKAKRSKRNPGEIISFVLPGMAGNPARKRKKGKKSMAATKKSKKKASAHSKNAGRRSTKHMKKSHHRRRSNPAGFAMRDILYLGAGAVVAPPVTGAVTQMILGAGNTGPIGYAVNLAATGVLAWVAHMFVKNRAFAAGILAGGVGAVMRRAIGDYTPYGSLLAGSGVGDYMIQNSAVMQRLPDALSSAQVENPGGPWAATMLPAGGMAPSVISSSGAGVGDYYGQLY